MSLRDLAIAGGVALLAVGGVYLKGRLEGAAAEKPKTELATDDAAGRGLEVKGAAVTLQRTEAALHQARQIQEKTHALVVDIRSDPATSAPLAPARAARLRAHDRFLCDQRPALCPAAADGDTLRGLY